MCCATARAYCSNILWSDLHVEQRSLDISVTHQLHERGQAHPGAIMSEAKVCRKRWGLARLMLVVWRWKRNKDRNPARVMRAPRMRPLSETNSAAEQGFGRSRRR